MTTYTFIGPGTSWSTSTNWSPNGVPDSNTAQVVFDASSPAAVNTDGSRTVNSIILDNSGDFSLTVGTADTLTLAGINPTITRTVAAGSGAVRIGNPIVLAADATVSVERGILEFSGGIDCAGYTLTVTGNGGSVFIFGHLRGSAERVIRKLGAVQLFLKNSSFEATGEIFSEIGTTVLSPSESVTVPNNILIGNDGTVNLTSVFGAVTYAGRITGQGSSATLIAPNENATSPLYLIGSIEGSGKLQINSMGKLRFSPTVNATITFNIESSSGNLAAGAALTIDSTNDVTLSGIIRSTSEYCIAHTGSGKLTLTGSSTSSGRISVGAGGLAISPSAAFASFSNNILNDTVSPITIDSSNNMILYGVLSGSAEQYLTKSGTGILTFANNSTAAGVVTVNSGIININPSFSITIANSFNNSDEIHIWGTGTVTLSGTLSGTGSSATGKYLVHHSTMALTLSGNNTSTGGIDVMLASVIIANTATAVTISNDIYCNTQSVKAHVNITGSKAVTMTGTLSGGVPGNDYINNTGTGSLTLTGGNTSTGHITAGSGGLYITPSSDVTIDNSFSNSTTSPIYITSDHKVTLSGQLAGTANQFLTFLGNGILELSYLGYATGTITVGSGGLVVRSPWSGASYANSIHASTKGITIAGSNGASLTGTLSGAANPYITFEDPTSGTVTLAGSSTATGDIDLGAGNSVTLSPTISSTFTNRIMNNSTLLSDSLVVDSVSDVTLAGELGGSATACITHRGAGRLMLLGDVTASGSITTLFGSGGLFITPNEEAHSTADSAASIHCNIVNSSTYPIVVTAPTGGITLIGNLSGTAANYLTHAGTGPLRLLGASTATGKIVVGSGVLTIENPGEDGEHNVANAIVNDVAGDAASALVVIASFTGVTLTGEISGTAPRILNANGSGALRITHDSTCTGAITVDGTVLDLSANLSSASVNLVNGSTLRGSGVIGVATLINSTLSPGNSPGLLTFSSLTLGAYSTINWELTDNTQDGRGALWDAINVTGNLTIDPTASLSIMLLGDANIDATFWDEARSWGVFSCGSISGQFDTGRVLLIINDIGRTTAPFNGTSRGTFSAPTVGTGVFVKWSLSVIIDPGNGTTPIHPPIASSWNIEYLWHNASSRPRNFMSFSDSLIASMLFYPPWISQNKP
jgi:autotransporter-associated beta strand protein